MIKTRQRLTVLGFTFILDMAPRAQDPLPSWNETAPAYGIPPDQIAGSVGKLKSTFEGSDAKPFHNHGHEIKL